MKWDRKDIPRATAGVFSQWTAILCRSSLSWNIVQATLECRELQPGLWDPVTASVIPSSTLRSNIKMFCFEPQKRGECSYQFPYSLCWSHQNFHPAAQASTEKPNACFTDSPWVHRRVSLNKNDPGSQIQPDYHYVCQDARLSHKDCLFLSIFIWLQNPHHPDRWNRIDCHLLHVSSTPKHRKELHQRPSKRSYTTTEQKFNQKYKMCMSLAE